MKLTTLHTLDELFHVRPASPFCWWSWSNGRQTCWTRPLTMIDSAACMMTTTKSQRLLKDSESETFIALNVDCTRSVMHSTVSPDSHYLLTSSSKSLRDCFWTLKCINLNKSQIKNWKTDSKSWRWLLKHGGCQRKRGGEPILFLSWCKTLPYIYFIYFNSSDKKKQNNKGRAKVKKLS